MDDTVLRIVDLVKGDNNVLIHGYGGTGKTYMIRQLLLNLKDLYNIKVASSTGISAVLINDLLIETPYLETIRCTTLHSFLGIELGRGSNEEILKKIMNNKFIVERLKQVDILIIDEISMIGLKTFELMNYVLSKVRKSNVIFGGVKFILIGDYYQLPPVKDSYIFKSKLYEQLDLNPVILTKPMRTDNINFLEILNRIRLGKHTEDDVKFIKSLNDKYINKDHEKLDLKPIVLCSKRADANRINDTELDKLPTDKYTFKCVDKKIKGNVITDENNDRLFNDTIDSLLTFKVGALVMLKYNLNVSKGLINGLRGKITKITDEIVDVLFDGFVVSESISHYTWSIRDEEGECEYTRKQIPLILAYAITIHKSQGLTLTSGIIDLMDIFFDHGVYVALSRFKTPDNIFISNFNKKSIKTSEQVLNYIKSIEP